MDHIIGIAAALMGARRDLGDRRYADTLMMSALPDAPTVDDRRGRRYPVRRWRR